MNQAKRAANNMEQQLPQKEVTASSSSSLLDQYMNAVSFDYSGHALFGQDDGEEEDEAQNTKEEERENAITPETTLPRGGEPVPSQPWSQLPLTEPGHTTTQEDLERLDQALGIGAGNRWGKRSKKGGRRKRGVLTAEAQTTLGQANLAYTLGNYQECIQLLHSVIQACPEAPEPWSTLAIAHDVMGGHQKALQAWLLAAHCTNPPDEELWVRLGKMSLSVLGLAQGKAQAIYCLKKALRNNAGNVDALLELASIYQRSQEYSLAIATYLRLNTSYPHTMPFIKPYAELCLELHQPEKALALFMDAFDADQNEPLYEMSEDGTSSYVAVRIGWEELNILTELQLDQAQYTLAMTCILIGTSRICQTLIQDEGAFNDIPDFPVELRIKYGICKLYLGDVEAAVDQFARLYSYSIVDFVDSYWEVGRAYHSTGHFQEALDIFETLSSDAVTDGPEVWGWMARCFQELGQIEVAKELWMQVLRVSEGLDEEQRTQAQFSLASILETCGEHAAARALLSAVPKSGMDQLNDNGQAAEMEVDSEDATANTPTALLPTVNRAEREREARRKKHVVDEAYVQAAAVKHAAENVAWFDKLSALQAFRRSSPCTSGSDLAQLLLYSRNLLNRFHHYRPPYPQSEAEVFHGLSMRCWYSIFYRYAYACARDGNPKLGIAELEPIKQIWERVPLHILALVSQSPRDEFSRGMDVLRWMGYESEHRVDLVRLFSVLFASSPSAFATPSVQKYYFRCLSPTISPAICKSPHILTLYGWIMCSGRSFPQAISYFSSALSMLPNEPMILLSLGISHAHRAAQRKSHNRHYHVLQAVSLLTHYLNIIQDEGPQRLGEAYYNVGRLFHQLGLLTNAITFYQKSLDFYENAAGSSINTDSYHSGKYEAAYNLHLLFMTVGSYASAAAVLKKYMTFK